MEKEELEKIISECKKGDILEVITLDKHGQYNDKNPGDPTEVSTLYYYNGKGGYYGPDKYTIMVSQHRANGRMQAPHTILHNEQIIKVKRIKGL